MSGFLRSIAALDVIFVSESELGSALDGYVSSAILDGYVAAPGSSTDNAVVRFDGTTGKIIQDSLNVIIDDLGNLTVSAKVQMDTVTPTAAGDIGMDTVTGRPQAFINGVVKALAHTGEPVTILLRNESGSTIAKGKLVFAAGFASGRVTVGLADKDDPAKRPAIAVTTASVPNLTDFDGLVSGFLDNVDTSSFSLTDQLVLGDDGNFSRPPPDQDPFTGEVQPVGSTVRISATVGIIQVEAAQGLQRMTADEGFGLTSVLGRGRKFGGALSRGGGLNLDVSAGEGFVSDGVEYRRVIWSADTIAIPANVTRFVFVDSVGTVTTAAASPNLDTNVSLGSVKSDGTSIVFISEHSVLLTAQNAGVSLFQQEVIGPVTSSGGTATINGTDALKIDVDAATFYISGGRHSVLSTAPITFTYWFRDGSGGFSFVTSQTQVDVNNFDDGSGTLAPMTAGKFKKDALYVSVFDSAVEYHLVYGQEQFDSQSEAEVGNLPIVAEDLRVFAWRSSGVVILKAAASITSIVDERPFIGQLSTGTTEASDHGLQGGLGDDDHPQYQLGSEKNVANGYAGLDASSKLTGSQQVYGSVIDTAVVGNDTRVPTQDENDALVGTGTPSTVNVFVTNDDIRLAPTVDTIAIVKGSVDGTKQVRVEVDGLTTATTRVITMPDKDVTLDDASDPRTDNNAIHDNAAGEIAALTEKVTPVNADLVIIEDSADANAKKKIQIGSFNGVVLQTDSAEVTTDTTSPSTSFVDLLTVNMTTGANFIIIDVTASLSTDGANNNAQIRILVDGASKGGGGEDLRTSGVASSFAIKKRIPITAAAHVIKLQWRTNSNTLQCRPITGAVDVEHASLVVQEVSG